MFEMSETRKNYLRIPANARATIPVTSNLLCLRMLILQAKKSCTKAEVMPCSEAQNHMNAHNVCYLQSSQELENINEVNTCPTMKSKLCYRLKRLRESVNHCNY